ncbi:hypothetical protein BB561_004454 [Smittium simulii]|uniref:Uncharacterized protein n=1 Tax=Smittium simulii TaxID=133385 RepID=A0A2T9YG38_9FUNG|nr:hypothetical protein BB561_004454 [Smittium simulii]
MQTPINKSKYFNSNTKTTELPKGWCWSVEPAATAWKIYENEKSKGIKSKIVCTRCNKQLPFVKDQSGSKLKSKARFRCVGCKQYFSSSQFLLTYTNMDEKSIPPATTWLSIVMGNASSSSSKTNVDMTTVVARDKKVSDKNSEFNYTPTQNRIPKRVNIIDTSDSADNVSRVYKKLRKGKNTVKANKIQKLTFAPKVNEPSPNNSNVADNLVIFESDCEKTALPVKNVTLDRIYKNNIENLKTKYFKKYIKNTENTENITKKPENTINITPKTDTTKKTIENSLFFKNYINNTENLKNSIINTNSISQKNEKLKNNVKNNPFFINYFNTTEKTQKYIDSNSSPDIYISSDRKSSEDTPINKSKYFNSNTKTTELPKGWCWSVEPAATAWKIYENEKSKGIKSKIVCTRCNKQLPFVKDQSGSKLKSKARFRCVGCKQYFSSSQFLLTYTNMDEKSIPPATTWLSIVMGNASSSSSKTNVDMTTVVARDKKVSDKNSEFNYTPTQNRIPKRVNIIDTSDSADNVSRVYKKLRKGKNTVKANKIQKLTFAPKVNEPSPNNNNVADNLIVFESDCENTVIPVKNITLDRIYKNNIENLKTKYFKKYIKNTENITKKPENTINITPKTDTTKKTIENSLFFKNYINNTENLKNSIINTNSITQKNEKLKNNVKNNPFFINYFNTTEKTQKYIDSTSSPDIYISSDRKSSEDLQNTNNSKNKNIYSQNTKKQISDGLTQQLKSLDKILPHQEETLKSNIINENVDKDNDTTHINILDNHTDIENFFNNNYNNADKIDIIKTFDAEKVYVVGFPRMKYRELKGIFYGLGFNSKKIFRFNYIASNLIEVFITKDYKTEFTDLVKEIEVIKIVDSMSAMMIVGLEKKNKKKSPKELYLEMIANSKSKEKEQRYKESVEKLLNLQQNQDNNKSKKINDSQFFRE